MADNYSIGINNNHSAPYIAYTTVNASGGNNNYGIYNYYFSPELFDVKIVASGGNIAISIYNTNSSDPPITNSVILASGAADNRGINHKFTSGASLIRNTRISASGGTDNCGIYTDESSLTMVSVWINASGGTGINYGVRTSGSGIIRLDSSVVRGNSRTISNNSGVTTNLGSTKLEGGNWFNAGVIHCVGCYDENYGPIANQYVGLRDETQQNAYVRDMVNVGFRSGSTQPTLLQNAHCIIYGVIFWLHGTKLILQYDRVK